MHTIAGTHLMQIEPTGLNSYYPVDDELTEKMQQLLDNAKEGRHWKGFHMCICGKMSGSCDLIVNDRYITNSLAVHYLRWHRHDVPETEIEKLKAI